MKQKLRALYTTLVCILAPTFSKPRLLNFAGHCIDSTAAIGMSVILGSRLYLGAGASIGTFNLISARRLILRENAAVGNMNLIKGPTSIHLKGKAGIGNRNIIICSGLVERGGRPSHLVLGKQTKLTAGHYVDCFESIVWGDFGTLAGVGSQMWTHGYVHDDTGPGRAFVRGRIVVGDNVYVGAHSVMGAGISIGDAISVGAHSSVAADLVEPGVYVSAPLRRIRRTPHDRLARLERLADGSYWKGA